MRKNKALLAILGTSALLFSCAVSLSRDEATELLDRIVLRVAEGDFEVPETYSYSSHSVYSTEHEQDINYSYAKTSKYHYMHCKTVTKTGNKDVTDSNGTYKASETETVDEYYRRGLIKNIADLYRIQVQDINGDGSRERSARNIVNAIDRSRQVPFERVVFALGIRFVGEISARLLARHFDLLFLATRSLRGTADKIVHFFDL